MLKGYFSHPGCGMPCHITHWWCHETSNRLLLHLAMLLKFWQSLEMSINHFWNSELTIKFEETGYYQTVKTEIPPCDTHQQWNKSSRCSHPIFHRKITVDWRRWFMFCKPVSEVLFFVIYFRKNTPDNEWKYQSMCHHTVSRTPILCHCKRSHSREYQHTTSWFSLCCFYRSV